jgi:hypothetical protein
MLIHPTITFDIAMHGHRARVADATTRLRVAMPGTGAALPYRTRGLHPHAGRSSRRSRPRRAP